MRRHQRYSEPVCGVMFRESRLTGKNMFRKNSFFEESPPEVNASRVNPYLNVFTMLLLMVQLCPITKPNGCDHVSCGVSGRASLH